MKLKLSWSYVFAFLALLFLMHEIHEIVHTTIGRFFCGCWGKRDFNVWGLCEDCPETNPLSIIATFAGPIFTFAMIWWGTVLLKSNSMEKRSIGFSVIFASLPFARILTAAFGGGDEVFGLSKIIDDYTISWILGLGIIVIILVIPLYRSYKIIQNRYKVLWFLAFLMLPLLIDILVVLGGMNTLLERGFLSEYWILGSPKLVTLWTLVILILFLISNKKLKNLGVSNE